MDDLIPSEFYLGQNYPNPFKNKTTIKYCIPYKTKVRITIYNSEGNMIEKLVDEIKEAGTYEFEFSVSELEKSNISAFAKAVAGKQHQASGLPSKRDGIEHRVSSIEHLVSTPLFYQMKAGDYLSEKKMTLVE